jgi:CheY-like chemotaxis protein
MLIMTKTELRKYAADKGVEILLGSWSICPTSKSFKKDWGTAEEHLSLGLRLSKAVGSPAFRVVLGSRDDRRTPGGIEARIADTVKVLKACQNQALDLGVKVSVENHAGDMTAEELITLIEGAGREFVGANMDSGNAAWTLEDPLDSLEKLGPYAITTSLRDSRIWQTDKGCKVQWTAMGDGGCVDLNRYFDRYAQLCPGVAVNIETIGGYLEERGYGLHYATNGLVAVRFARQLHPALILMDIQMPVMDGLAAIREIRADPQFDATPIVALTALAMPGDRERCLESGVDDDSSKPIKT